MLNLQQSFDHLSQHNLCVGPTPRTHLELLGGDRASFLHNLCTNHITQCEPGQGCEAFITNVQGRTLGLVRVFTAANAIYLETSPHQSETLTRQFDKYQIREDVQWIDRSDAWATLHLMGPSCETVLHEICDACPQDPYGHQPISLENVQGQLRRIPWDPTIWQLVTPHENLAQVQQSLEKLGFQIGDARVLEVLRIAARYPEFPQDFSEKNLPQELGRDASAISFVKGCYLGQETVARLDALGHVNQSLQHLLLSAAPECEFPASVQLTQHDQVVGTLTSRAFDPRDQRWHGLAMVRVAAAQSEEPLGLVDADDPSSEVCRATVVADPSPK